MGILGVISVPLGWLLSFIYSLVNNYGITLIIFTVLVKVCLYPLYASQIKSTAAMTDIQPKVQEIQRKYAKDQETLNQKLMELYKEEKFNPLGGCLPMLIQMPILLGLFGLLRNPMAYISTDTMLLAIHESFIWIMDLSQPDLWILPIAAGIATFINFSQTQSQQSDNAASAQMAPVMKMMKFIFPLMIVLMGRSFPAGLSIYWFVGTLVQICFNFRLNKLRRKMKLASENKKNK